jgi:AcrR family transcriptional regulator
MADTPAGRTSVHGGPARRKWRGIEPDARTAERRERVIEAAIAQLSSDGLNGTTVRAVCTRAGLHSRYFYESFESIDALLVAVFDRLSSQFLEYVTAAAAGAGDRPRARVEAVIRAIAEVFVQQRELVRILTIEAVGSEELNRRRIRLLHRMAAMIEADAHRASSGPPMDPGVAAVSARFLAGGLAELFIAWIDGELAGDIDQLERDAADVIMAFAEASRRVSGRPADRPAES